MFHNTHENFNFLGGVERQKVSARTGKVIHNRPPKWWKTFGRFAWRRGGIDVLLRHESCDDSRERARVAHSSVKLFIILVNNELLLL